MNMNEKLKSLLTNVETSRSFLDLGIDQDMSCFFWVLMRYQEPLTRKITEVWEIHTEKPPPAADALEVIAAWTLEELTGCYVPHMRMFYSSVEEQAECLLEKITDEPAVEAVNRNIKKFWDSKEEE